MTDTKKNDLNPDAVTITPEMIEAGRDAMEEHAFTSMEGYNMEKALPAAFRAMLSELQKGREEDRYSPSRRSP